MPRPASLVICPGCRLPYDNIRYPGGCPRCADDPSFAAMRRRQLAEEAERAERRFALTNPVARVGWVVGLVAVYSGLCAFWLFDTGSMIDEAGREYRGAQAVGVLNLLSVATYAGLSIALLYGVAVCGWVALGVLALDSLVNGGIAVTLGSKSAMYAVAPKLLAMVVIVRLMLARND